MTQRILSPAAPVKVRLLQDAIYSEDDDLWELLQRYRQHLQDYFRELGLGNGPAALQRLDRDVLERAGITHVFYLQGMNDIGGGASAAQVISAIQQIIDRVHAKGLAIIGILLREQLLHFDQTIHDEPRLVVSRSDLAVLAAPFFPNTTDEIRSDRRIDGAITKAEEFGLLRKLPGSEGDERYEVRRIVKARFPLETLKQLRDQLVSTDSDHGEPS